VKENQTKSQENKEKNKDTGIIAEFKTFTTQDGPGIRTTVFVKGCPLRCKWCSNPETWTSTPQIYFHAKKCKADGACLAACPVGAINMNAGEDRIIRDKCNLCMACVEACPYEALQRVGEIVTPQEIADRVSSDKPFFDRSGGGVTVSGGEPLAQPDFTAEVMRICHEKGINTCLDTSGYASPEALKKVLPHADLVLLDIKHMDSKKHEEWTGVPNEIILENAKTIAKEKDMRISIPLIPGFNDDEENIRKTAEFAKSIGVKNIDVEPFHKLGDGKYIAIGMKSPYGDFTDISEEKVDEVREIIESYGIETTRGRNA
jgi:glycyl-radical enzyme activating protein